MEKMLEVKYGSIYTKAGIMIDNMAIIVDKASGLMKYGSFEKITEYYQSSIEKFAKVGASFVTEDWVMISFDRYEGVLTMEEVCTLCNQFILCALEGERIIEILSMNEDNLKKHIARLAEIGY